MTCDNTCASFGDFSKFAVEAVDGNDPRQFDDGSERYGILAESLKKIQPFQGRRRITGNRDLYSAAVRPHSFSVRGAFAMQPGPADMSLWLPRATWGTKSGTSIPLGDTCPDYDILIYKEAKTLHYPGAITARQVYESTSESGAEPTTEELIRMTNYVFAEDELDTTTWPDPEPTLDLTSANAPYTHSDGAFTFNGNATPFRNWRLTFDNMLRPLYYNSLGPTCFRSMGRRITLEMQNPFTGDTWTDAKAALNTGVAGTLTLTNGNMSTSFVFAHLRNRYETPSIRGRGEIPMILKLEAFRTSGAAPVVITHDDTP